MSELKIKIACPILQGWGQNLNEKDLRKIGKISFQVSEDANSSFNNLLMSKFRSVKDIEIETRISHNQSPPVQSFCPIDLSGLTNLEQLLLIISPEQMIAKLTQLNYRVMLEEIPFKFPNAHNFRLHFLEIKAENLEIELENVIPKSGMFYRSE